jgi:hypothetical protein
MSFEFSSITPESRGLNPTLTGISTPLIKRAKQQIDKTMK